MFSETELVTNQLSIMPQRPTHTWLGFGTLPNHVVINVQIDCHKSIHQLISINRSMDLLSTQIKPNLIQPYPTYIFLSLSTSPSGHPVQAYLLILLHSILFYILFYSALFCSILFSALLFYSFLLTWYPKINILRFFGGTIMINHALDFEAPYFRTKNRT